MSVPLSDLGIENPQSVYFSKFQPALSMPLSHPGLPYTQIQLPAYTQVQLLPWTQVHLLPYIQVELPP